MLLLVDPAEKYHFRRNVTSLYRMPSGRKLRRMPAMTELSSPDSETIIVGPLEPPILPLIRTSRPFGHHKPGTSSKNFSSDAGSGIGIESGPGTRPIVSAQIPNPRKRSRDDQADDDRMTRPTTRLCIEAPPPSSPTDDKGQLGSSHNCYSKKRSYDVEEDEGEVARHSPRRRQESPAVRPRYPSPTPSDRRIGRIIAPFGKSFRFNPRSPSPESDNGSLGSVENKGNSEDNLMASPSGASTEASRKE